MAADRATNEALRAQRRRAASDQVRVPVIYINYFVHSTTFRGFTRAELTRLVVLLRLYLDDTANAAAYAHEIDNAHCAREEITLNESKNGVRKFLGDSRRTGREADARLLVDSIERRIYEENDDAWSLLPFTEVGYTIDSRNRRRARANGANKLMMLTFKICDKEWPNVFKIDFHVVYCIPMRSHAAVAEMAISMLAHAYAQNGSGFNCFAAGLSVSSVNEVAEREGHEHLVWNNANNRQARVLATANRNQEAVFADDEAACDQLVSEIMVLGGVKQMNRIVERPLPTQLEEDVGTAKRAFEAFL